MNRPRSRLRTLAISVAGGVALAAGVAAPAAQAGLGTWTNLPGLNVTPLDNNEANDAAWVREYTRAGAPNITHMYAATEDDGVFAPPPAAWSVGRRSTPA